MNSGVTAGVFQEGLYSFSRGIIQFFKRDYKVNGNVTC